MDDLLVIIVPVRNDERTLPGVFRELRRELDSIPMHVEVHAVDDASHDGSTELCERALEEGLLASFRRHERHVGRGRAVQSVWARVPEGAWVTSFPGDREFLFSSIHGFLAVRDDYDVLLGYPRNRVVQPLARRLVSRTFTEASRAVYGLRFRYLSGMKLYRIEAFRGLDIVSTGRTWSSELLAKALLRNPHLRVGEVPFVLRTDSSSAEKALHPTAMVRAARDFAAGVSSVSRYRDRIITDDD
jgi:glycosyltransferase involved in cell wall biosynthesis